MKRGKRLIKFFLGTFIFIIGVMLFFGASYEAQGITNRALGEGWILIYSYTKSESGFRMEFGWGMVLIIMLLSFTLERIFIRYFPIGIFNQLMEKPKEISEIRKNSVSSETEKNKTV